MRALVMALAGLVLSAAGSAAAVADEVPALPAGSYSLDRAHTSVIFRVLHLGMSHFTARFTKVEATLELEPMLPGKSQLTATIATNSIRTDYPFTDVDFDAQIAGPEFLDAGQFPEIVYRSTTIVPTGDRTADVTGDLTLHGVTAPVTLEVTFNDGYASQPWDPAGSRIGFSAHGSLKRSAFGLANGIPPAGTNMGVGDEVEIVIEAEFTRPVEGGGAAQ